jgi:hypothetical protein
MRNKAKVTPWPNGLGWGVGADAEVCRIFTRDNKIRCLFIPDLGLNPVTAVERCKKEGAIEE